MARFGIEEEFLLLDEEALVPIGMADGTRERFTRLRTGGTVTAEYLTSQLETATEPVLSREDAETQVRHLRALVGWHAKEQQAIAAATGHPFATTRSSVISPSPHYDDVARRLGHLSRDHEVDGLHVHVEVTDEEERVRVLNRLRGWLPALLAISGNSPFANGLDTSFASWRSILIRRLPSSWCPPHFDDLDDYRAESRMLLDLDAIGETSSLSWAVRLSERFPTVEVRVFDAQLDPEDSVFAALFCRALAAADDRSLRHDRTDAIDASLWNAARWGMDARILDPTTGEASDAWTVVERMQEAAAPALQEFGDVDYVTDRLARLRAEGTGATRQRRAFEHDGTPGLAALLRAGTPTPIPGGESSPTT
ncbi:carboxylate-amine ligase [Microbacterium sp. SA39]|uniref:carboxylate-amine ligase n=1 Tax=Microbacterium sp. SA39 TaxID=1263625 RepID=UPI0005FA6B12|nr:YbdK family carboxylate-amine ligase [Microbacterium sp. SA39]KJQ53938.1 Carboxylate-amine ligase YbdK [Microbacterium sp. SA39]